MAPMIIHRKHQRRDRTES